jgi:hypothetical protein
MDRSQDGFRKLGAVWIASEKRWRFPSGATVEFGYCGTFEEAMQYQGQEFHYIGFDEIGQLPEERIWLFLMSNQRKNVPELQIMARASANPGGPGHGWLRRRFIVPCMPNGMAITDESGNTRAFVQARVYDNPTLLENDPAYVKYLESLPGVMRAQFLEGNWDVGTGLAFEGLTERSHTVPAVQALDPTWNYFGAFDWGYGHRWAFGLFGVAPTGVVVVMDSTGGRGMVPSEIVDRVASLLDAHHTGFSRLSYTVAGADVKIVDRARGNYGPSVLEQFIEHGWYGLMPADQNRPGGYANLLQHLHDRTLLFCETRANQEVLRQLMGLVVDPDAPNDVLKVDVDPVTGEGGDDWYDMLRYGMMSRPSPRRLGATTAPAKTVDRHLPWEARRQSSPNSFGLPAAALPGQVQRSPDSRIETPV